MNPSSDGHGGWPGRARVVLTPVLLSIVAGLVAWAAELALWDAFQPRLFPARADGFIAMEPSAESIRVAELENVALAWAILGGATGLAMGVAGGISGRNVSRGVVVGLFAQAGGVVVGVVLAKLLIPIWQDLYPNKTQDLLLPLLIHAAIHLPVGAVGGLAFAIGLGSYKTIPEIVLGAILGALLATVLLELATATLPADAGAALPLARWTSVRLAAILLPTMLISTGAAVGASQLTLLKQKGSKSL